jgi:hypothetical protein
LTKPRAESSRSYFPLGMLSKRNRPSFADFVWSARSSELNVRRTPATGAADKSLTAPVSCEQPCPGARLPATRSDATTASLDLSKRSPGGNYKGTLGHLSERATIWPGDEKPAVTKPSPPAFGISRAMTIVKTSTSHFACASPATTEANLSNIWFQPSNSPLFFAFSMISFPIKMSFVRPFPRSSKSITS